MADVNIILPERSRDSISEDLRYLTEFICRNQVGTDHDGNGGLGGSYGYGVNHENDVFMIHRFCWCEQPECPWCLECACKYHYEDPKEYKGLVIDEECRNCREKPEPAPQFLHKPSGSTVNWYKVDWQVDGGLTEDPVGPGIR
jgi:hypothetical protein